jgi:beta-glucosidase
MDTFIRISALVLLISCLNSKTASAQLYQTGTRQEKSEFQWPEGKFMALSLTFDDARESQVEKGIPLLDQFGVKATFYISPENLINRVDAWESACKNGHEIGNHTLVHPCSGNFEWSRHKALEDYTIQNMITELDSASKFIEKYLGVHPVSFAYTCGQAFVGSGKNTKSYVPVISALFETGRGWLDETPDDPLYCDMSKLASIELDGKSFEEVKQIIESAKNKGQWLIFAGHEMDEGGYQTSLLSTIEAICKYASDPSNGIWINTVHNIASYIKDKRGEAPFVIMPVYKNPIFSAEKRVEDLLSRMTLEEKIGQMNMPCVYVSELGNDKQSKMTGCEKLTEGDFMQGLGPIGGFFTLANTILHDGSREQADYFNKLQKIATEQTRLGIPLLETEEGTHGSMRPGATIFPEGLTIGSTWNMDIIKKIYTIAAREARAVGIHQMFTLVIEPNRDPRLGRNDEGFSEDPFLCSHIAETIAGAVQGDDLSAKDKTVAGFCHYPGQSQPISGLERGSMEISERQLREVFLPPWIAGIRKGGALGVMATYPAIDGIPTHASEFLLTDILRQEMGFKGLVLSEGGGFSTLVYTNLASDQKEAGELAIKAGVDVGISFEDAYLLPLIENVKEGKVSMDLIDRTVRRILEQKIRLGLFEDPYVDAQHAVEISHTKENQDVALQAAHEGIVLLKNEKNILPLRKDLKRIAVIGPNSDNEINQLGDYTPKVILQNIVTILDGIKASVSPNTIVEYVKGCDIIGTDHNDISRATKIAAASNAVIMVLGESAWGTQDGKITDGEGYDVASLDLTGLQEDLLRSVYKTGTPVILVLVNGRPLSIRWAAENIPAIIEAWLPGEKGGNAVADIIFGDYNPSGKLPITIPRHVGQLPFYYNYMPDKAYWIEHGWGKAYADMPASPLWEFGFGLSYTTFEYTNLQIHPGETGTFGEIRLSVDVTNTGKRSGEEVVQLYIRDIKASVVVPVKELQGFNKIALKPGEKKTVEFTLKHDNLAIYDRNMDWVVEPGTFEVMIGSSSKDIRVKGEFNITSDYCK